jgi:two-component system sensor histidine kinase and response regulator WspE
LGRYIPKLWEGLQAGDFESSRQAAKALMGGAYLAQFTSVAVFLDDLVSVLERGEPSSERIDCVQELRLLLKTDKADAFKRLEAFQAPVILEQQLPKSPETRASSTDQPSPVEGVDLDMMELFSVELETHVGVLSAGILRLEQAPNDAEILEQLMRAAHSIKGAARVVSVNQASQLAHALEDCFVAAQEGLVRLETAQVNVLLLGIDVLATLAGLELDEIQAWLETRNDAIDALSHEIQGVAQARALRSDLSRLSDALRLSDAIASEAEQKESSQVADPRQAVAAKPQKESSKGAAPKRARALRVSANSLDELMALAGESLVESRWLQPFGDSLLQLKLEQHSLAAWIDELREHLTPQQGDARLLDLLTQLQRANNRCRQQVSDRIADLDTYVRRHTSLSDRLYHEVIATRMRPFVDGVRGFPRLVRDIAQSLGKEVELRIEGESTPVDRDILERLEAPLNHMIRNAIDHGIECPEERRQQGKNPCGQIVLEARHRAGMLSISVRDDGQGVDIEQLRAAIVERGLSSQEVAERLSTSELLEFLFLPGFSTTTEVSDVSGRGVGLDVVQAVIQEVGGRVRIETSPGQGLSYHMQLPLTLSVMRALLTQIGCEPYAFPLARIDRVLMVDRQQVEQVEDRQFIHFEGENIGLLKAQQVLKVAACPEAQSEQFPVIVISDRRTRYGIAVERFLGERELVIQELCRSLGKIPNISSGALMEDGSPLLVVDCEDLVKSMDKMLCEEPLQKIGERILEIAKEQQKRILVVEDSTTVREVECRLLRNAGYEVDSAVDGQDGWNALVVAEYDLVITDIDMPRMNGFELIEQMKADVGLKDIPIIVVSYKDRETDRQRGLDLGANEYLTKSSFQDDTMLNAVKLLIGDAKPGRE